METKISLICLCLLAFGCASQQSKPLTENQQEIIDELTELTAPKLIQPVEEPKPLLGEKLYLSPFVTGHSECDKISETLMSCPTNAVNERQPGESLSNFLDRDNEWGFHPSKDDMPGDCVEQDDNIMLCRTHHT